ncbi:MAG TPA: MoxR family ATPase [Terriglobia bacterium]|nr:MoxR family ATPase [Terriglobia bacterium]
MGQDTNGVEQQVHGFQTQFKRVRDEVAKVIVGYDDVIDGVVMSLLANGHVLLEGVPGLGKTKLVSTLANVLDLKFSRIQFTPDLMPADITGTNVVREKESGEKFLEFQPGPIFANIVLADEINRATPKTQSALLEAMEEKRVTVGKTSYRLEAPFFVLATQNPLEMEGTYPLPEAQLDRFFMKLKVEYPDTGSMRIILDRTTQSREPEVGRVLDGGHIQEMRKIVRSVPIARPVQDYAIRIMMATHPRSEYAHPLTDRYVRCGASPRGAQALVLGARMRALLSDRLHVSSSDIRSVALGALRHRVLLNFEGEAERVSTDTILAEIVKSTPEPN